LDRVRDEVALQLDRGVGLAEVHRLIEAARGLSEDEQDALWLFAWSYRPGAGQSVESVLGLG